MALSVPVITSNCKRTFASLLRKVASTQIPEHQPRSVVALSFRVTQAIQFFTITFTIFELLYECDINTSTCDININTWYVFFVCFSAVVHSLLKSAFNTVAIEKEKIKQVLSEQELSNQSSQIMTLRHSLSQVSTGFFILLIRKSSLIQPRASKWLNNAVSEVL